MKILMICTVELGKNGIASCILNYFDSLIKEYQIDILAPNIVDQDIRKKIEERGRVLYELPVRKNNTLFYFLRLIEIIRKGKYDIVHVHGNSCTMAIELAAAALAGCRVRIAHSHNTACEHVRAHKILRPVFEIVCTGRFACGIDAGKWLFQEKDFIVIKNGIDIDEFSYNPVTRKRIRKELGLDDEQILLGHVGLFNYQKNHEFLFHLFKVISEKDSKYYLLCLGDGNTRSEMEQFVIQNGLSSKVFFMGNVDNVSDYMQAMDCFLLPSHYEGLPYVLIEAQAAGLNCFVSDRVSTEVNVSKTIRFLPLKIENWCRHILSMKYTRFNNDDKLRHAGFDIKRNARVMADEYRNLIAKG